MDKEQYRRLLAEEKMRFNAANVATAVLKYDIYCRARNEPANYNMSEYSPTQIDEVCDVLKGWGWNVEKSLYKIIRIIHEEEANGDQ